MRADASRLRRSRCRSSLIPHPFSARSALFSAMTPAAPSPPVSSTTMAETPPPIGSSWRMWYTIVLVALAIETAIFYAFTRAFA